MNKRITQGIFYLFTIFAGLIDPATAQQHLLLDEAVKTSIENNSGISVARMDEQIAASRYKQTDAILLPQVSFSYAAFITNNPLNAFGFKLQQKQIEAEDFNPAKLNGPKARPDFVTKMDLQQTIFNPDLWYNRKAAAMQIDLFSLATQRTQEFVALEVEKAYLQLQLSYQVKTVLQSALKTAKAFQKLSADYFKEGLLQKSDLLNADLHVTVTETKIAEAENSIRNVSDVLSWLMNKTAGVVYTVSEQQPLLINTDSAMVSYERADLRSFQKGIEAYGLMITGTRKSYLPRLNAFASYQFNNAAMLKYDANAYLAGIQLSWDIFKGNSRKNKIMEQQLEKQKMQQQLQQQINQSSLQLEQAKRDAENAKYRMQQYKVSVEQAEESLRIIQNRFQQGLAKSADVLAGQTLVAQQQMAYAEAVHQYNVSVYTIQFLTSTVKK